MGIQADVPKEAYFDTSGRRIKKGMAPHAIGVPPALREVLRIPATPRRIDKEFAASETAVACLELHSVPYVINIQITVDLTSGSQTSPYAILGVSFGGDFCAGPEAVGWQVTEGYIGEPFLLLNAEQAPPVDTQSVKELAVGSCAQSIIILGIYVTPLTYGGIYGFDGEIFSFSHRTLFKGWQACS